MPALADHPVTTFIPYSAWALVGDRFSPYALETLEKLVVFVRDRCIPADSTFHSQVSTDPAKRWTQYPPIMEELKAEAKALGLWNLFLSKEHYPDVGVPLTNLEYGVMAEVMGHALVAPEACNCNAPDSGDMEVLARYGTPAQKEKWLVPLLDGTIRSAFAMTEPEVASSDATNIQTSIRQEGNEIVINGRKWWCSSSGHAHCKFHIVMGKSDTSASSHQQQSIVIVPVDTPGITLIRPLTVLGFDDAPEGHFEITYVNVRVPLSNLVAGWGRGFEIVQGRLGPGRIHHCMRSLGVATRALELMLLRATEPKKVAFGKQLREHGVVVANIAESRMEIDQARLMVLSAALQIDLVKAKGAMKEIGMAKAIVPAMVNRVVDRAMQLHGAEGVCQDTPLAHMFASIRGLRIADGPDDVHISQVGNRELRSAPLVRAREERTATLERATRAKAGFTA